MKWNENSDSNKIQKVQSLTQSTPIDSTFSLIGLFSTTEYVVESPVKILPRPVSARKKALAYFGTIQRLSPLVPSEYESLLTA